MIDTYLQRWRWPHLSPGVLSGALPVLFFDNKTTSCYHLVKVRYWISQGGEFAKNKNRNTSGRQDNFASATSRRPARWNKKKHRRKYPRLELSKMFNLFTNQCFSTMSNIDMFTRWHYSSLRDCSIVYSRGSQFINAGAVFFKTQTSNNIV